MEDNQKNEGMKRNFIKVKKVVLGLLFIFAFVSIIYIGYLQAFSQKVMAEDLPIVTLPEENLGEQLNSTNKTTIIATPIETDAIFKELVVNDATAKTAIFELDNPEITALSKEALTINFREDFGHVKSYKIMAKKNISKTIQDPMYGIKEICHEEYNEKALKNISVCANESVIVGYKSKDIIIEEWAEIDNIPVGTQDYKIEADIEPVSCGPMCFTYAIEWIPTFTTTSKEYTQAKWAWWNATSNLSTKLIAYFNMSEASGNLIDVFADYDVAQLGTPNSSFGKIGLGRSGFGDNTLFYDETWLAHGYENFSVSFWLFVYGTKGGSQYPFIYGEGSNNFKMSLYINEGDTPDTWRFEVAKDGVAGYSCVVNITGGYNRWYHIVGTSDKNKMGFFYVDGSQACSVLLAQATVGSAGDNLYIAGYPGGNYEVYGVMDEFGVWDKNLTEQDISNLYNGGAGLKFELYDPNPPASLTYITKALRGRVFLSDSTTAAVNATVNIFLDSNRSLIATLGTNSTGGFNWSTTEINMTSRIYMIVAESLSNRTQGGDVATYVNMTWN